MAGEEELGAGVPIVLQGNIIVTPLNAVRILGDTIMVSCMQKYSASQYILVCIRAYQYIP